MERDALLDLFRRSGALLDGHFRLSSGLHSTGYLQCALVLQHPDNAETLGRAIARRAAALRPTVVLSPALGGVVIGQEVGRALGVRAIFAERQDGALALRRGFTLSEDDRVLVVEDVVTTGGSTRETMQVARAAGAQVVGAASIVDRGGRVVRIGRARSKRSPPIALPTYEAGLCPLCAKGLPVVKPGSRAGGRSRPCGMLRMPTFKITLAYDGTGFVGWQRQASGTSIQGLPRRDALSRVVSAKAAVAGGGPHGCRCSRAGQVQPGFTLAREIEPDAVVRALNAQLPERRVLPAAMRRPIFHARFDARSKTYRYRIWNADVASPFERDTRGTSVATLDVASWRRPRRAGRGAPRFRGVSGGGRRQPHDRARTYASRIATAGGRTERGLITYEIAGTGFLRHMVRTIVGTLVEIGRGRRPAEWLREVLASRDRGGPAPPHRAQGLYS